METRSQSVAGAATGAAAGEAAGAVANVNLTAQQLLELMTATNRVNFSTCTAKFNGSPEATEVNHFITQADLHKRTSAMTDEVALQSLPALFGSKASQWWDGVRNQANTWDAALQLIRNAFSPALPSYEVYQQLFKVIQRHDESTDDFITRQRYLLAQLTERPPSAETCLDIVYGSLRPEIRMSVPRSSIVNLDQLLPLARIAETHYKLLRTLTQPTHNTQTEDTRVKKVVKTCNFCKNRGHLVDECRKLKNKQEPSKLNELKCFGCGTPGVFRRDCPKCTGKENI